MVSLQIPHTLPPTAFIAVHNTLCLKPKVLAIILSIIAFTSFQPCTSAQQIAKALTKHRPRRLGLGGLAVKTAYGFKTPVVYQVALPDNSVDALLPTPLAPRLHRTTPGFNGKMEKIFMKPGFIKLVNSKLHAAKSNASTSNVKQLHDLMPPMQSYNYALTAHTFSFSKTGTSFGLDHLSKHSIISSDIRDVRFAGQMWREGDTLWFSGNSGTYMKKRKKSGGLNSAPDHEPMLIIMQRIFSPMLTPAYSSDIAPRFGDDEAKDQATKAVKAAKDAEEEAARTKDATLARQLRNAAARARAKAAEADKAYKAVHRINPQDDAYLRSDHNAGKVALEAKKARKVIEKLLEIGEDE